MIYVLTQEYADKSAFKVCGATSNYHVAVAWDRASEETHVYSCPDTEISPHFQGLEAWPK